MTVKRGQALSSCKKLSSPISSKNKMPATWRHESVRSTKQFFSGQQHIKAFNLTLIWIFSMAGDERERKEKNKHYDGMCVHRSLWIRFTSALPNPWPFRSHRFALSASVPLRGPFFPPLCPCHGASSPVLIYDSCVVTQTFPFYFFHSINFHMVVFLGEREKKKCPSNSLIRLR